MRPVKSLFSWIAARATARRKRTVRATFADPAYKARCVDALMRAKTILDRYRVPFWLDWGTLLGYVRNGDLLDHDFDIDLGVLAESWSADVDRAFRREGFQLYPHPISRQIADRFLGGRMPTAPGSFGIRRDGAALDLCIYFNRTGGGDRARRRFQVQWKNEGIFEFPARLVENYKDVFFLGTTFSIPRDETAYLCAGYGEDWTVPQALGTYSRFNYVAA